MAKEKTLTTFPPDTLGPGHPFRSTDVETIAALHGYVVGEVTETLIQFDGETRLQGAGVLVLDATVWVGAHVQEVIFAPTFRDVLGLSNVADLTLEVFNSTSALQTSLSFAYSTGVQPAAQTWVPPGLANYYRVEVSGQVTSGGGPVALQRLRAEALTIAAGSLPSPP